MNLKEKLKSVTKTVLGLGIMPMGGVMATVPLLQAASPAVISTGKWIAIAGAVDKGRKAVLAKGSIKDRLKATVEGETKMIEKITRKGGK